MGESGDHVWVAGSYTSVVPTSPSSMRPPIAYILPSTTAAARAPRADDNLARLVQLSVAGSYDQTLSIGLNPLSKPPIRYTFPSRATAAA